MFESLFALAVLSILDPAGDVIGDGTLKPPTAGVYRNLASFDLQRVTVSADEQLTLIVEMGSLANPFDLPLGFSLPVIEIYLDSGAEGGESELLPGSGMNLPAENTWDLAVRLSGEQAEAYRWSETGLESVTPTVSVEGNELTVRTPFPRPERPRIYAMTGLYDLFGSARWRPLDRSESPWAFSSTSQNSPVVDVLADDEAAQRHSIESQTLLPGGGSRAVRGAAWLVLMALGMLLALVGIAMRTLSRPGPEPQRNRDADSEGKAAEGRTRTPASSADERKLRQSPRTPVRNEGDSGEEFVWDSSALLIEPDDEFVEEFAEDRSEGESSAWVRPVPLPMESNLKRLEPGVADGEPEVVRDELEVEKEQSTDDESDAEEEAVGHEDKHEEEPD